MCQTRQLDIECLGYIQSTTRKNHRPKCMGNYGVLLTMTQDNERHDRPSRNTTHIDLTPILLSQSTLNSTRLSNNAEIILQYRYIKYNTNRSLLLVGLLLFCSNWALRHNQASGFLRKTQLHCSIKSIQKVNKNNQRKHSEKNHILIYQLHFYRQEKKCTQLDIESEQFSMQVILFFLGACDVTSQLLRHSVLFIWVI